MAEKQIIPAVVGLSGGFVIAGGVIALMVGLGIITRFVGITHTAKHVKGYETAILAGAIFGNLLTVHQIRIPLGIFGLVLMGVLFGIFVGGWILALAEIVNIFPIFARRIGITKGYSLIVIAIAVGKRRAVCTIFTGVGACRKQAAGRNVKNMKDVLKEQRNQKYNDYVKQVTPVHSLPLNMLKAFVTGGVICVIGQAILNYGDMLGLEKDIAASWCSLILIFVSVILTGLNIYPKLAKFGGAGTLVPITGFANSVAASAIEYQKEGQVFGIGCKIFTIAGPVILYGIFSSWVLGLIYWIFQVTVYQM